MTVPRAIERHVAARAAGRCEYCRMHQSLQGATFHVEHVTPRSRGGPATLDNLAWACPRCNLQKTNRVEVPDPATGHQTRLFDPRADVWHEHFCWKGFRLVGLSEVGRATVAALELNHARRIRIRQVEKLLGFFPPDEPSQ
jgi:hypothetical protein